MLSKRLFGTVLATLGTVFTFGTVSAMASSYAVVQPGQSMWKIAQTHGVSVDALEQANPSVNPMNLLVGTKLTLPTTENTSAVASSSTSTSSWKQNLYWLEHVINAEAGGESLETQIAVGDVILHRLDSGQYGNTVHDVVFQVTSGHYQFTSVMNGYIYTSPNASSIQAAIDVMNGQDVVPGAFVFYNPAQTPAGSWVWSQPTVSQIGHLVFAK